MAKKVVTKDDLKEYAKELYFQVDSNGLRKKSFREICTGLAQKLHKTVAPNTIKNWAISENWDATFLKIKQYGIEQATTTIEQKENEIIRKQGNVHAMLHTKNYEFYELCEGLAKQRFKDDPTIKAEAILKGMEISGNMLLKLNPVEQDKIENSIENLVDKLDDLTKQKLIDKYGL